MEIKELVDLLEKIQQVHPTVTAIEAFTKDGKPSHQISLRIKKGVLILSGEKL